MSSSSSRQHYQHTCCCPLYLFMPVCVRSLMFLTFDFILTPFNVTLQTGQWYKHSSFDVSSRFLDVYWLWRFTRLRVRCDDPPCPSGSAALWWACRLLCQRWCPAGTRRWGGAPTLASHPPWLTCSQHDLTTGTEKDRRVAPWIQERPNANRRAHFCMQSEDLKLVWVYCTIGMITPLTLHHTRSVLESRHFLGQPLWHNFHLNSTGDESL